MLSNQEQFSHFYYDCLRDLEIEKNRSQIEIDVLKNKPNQQILFKEFNRLLSDLQEELNSTNPEPELIMKKGILAIKKIDDFRFNLENLIEGIKGDRSLQNLMIDFKELELFEWNVEGLEKENEEDKKSPWPLNLGTGKTIKRLLNWLKKIAFILMEIVANAIKAIPKFMAIKPKPAIGLSGPFPTFSLQFELEAESMTIHELFRELKGAIE
jgi:hypothetical protein